MQGFSQVSDGAEGRRAAGFTENVRHEAHGAADRGGRNAGTLRESLAAFRAAQVERIAVRDGRPGGRRERRGAVLYGPRAGAAGRLEWRDILVALIPTRLALELALSFGTAAALVMFWNTFGTVLVTALTFQPVPQ